MRRYCGVNEYLLVNDNALTGARNTCSCCIIRIKKCRLYLFLYLMQDVPTNVFFVIKKPSVDKK